MSRVWEFGLGLAGGIIGLIFVPIFFIAAIFVDVIDIFGAVSNFFTFGTTDIGALISPVMLLLACLGAFVLSIVGVIGAALVNSKSTVGAVMMLIAGIGGFICLQGVFTVPGVLLLVAGAMGMIRKQD